MRNEHARLESKPREFLSYERVAAELGVSRKTVERMVREGRLQAVHLGSRSVRIARDDLDEFEDRLKAEEGFNPLDPKPADETAGPGADGSRRWAPQGSKERS